MKLPPIYRHTQVGWPWVILIGPLTVWMGLLAFDSPVPGPAVVGFLFLLLVLVNLTSLTVIVDDSHLRLRYGPGLLRFSFPLERINNLCVSRTDLLFGWGIRMTSRGWVYNIWGFEAVEVELVDGRSFRVGTDEPEALATAIENALILRRKSRQRAAG
jgi:hypothetical protein